MVEGDIIVLVDESIWVVKGCYHPPEGYVAVPRIVNGRKIKRVSEAFSIVKRYYRFMLKNVDKLGITVPVVPHEWVLHHYTWQNSSCPNASDDISKKCHELMSLILSECGLRCGVSGSLLGGYWTSKSDIDIMCYDSEGVYECLRNLRNAGILSPLSERIFAKELQVVSETLPHRIHSKLTKHRVTQGIFSGVSYTLRILNCSRETYLLGPYASVRKANVTLRTLSTDYRTPSIYSVELIRPHIPSYKDAYMMSYRVRFAELPKGTIISGKALLLLKDDKLVISFDNPGSSISFMEFPQP